MSQYSIAEALAHRQRNPPLPPPREPGGRRRPLRGLAIGVVMMAAAVGIAAITVRNWNRDGAAGAFEDPESVELPPLATNSEMIRDFLAAANGDKLRRVIDVSVVLETADTAEVCAAAASTLDSLGRPDELFGIADRMPDAPTREIVLALLDELARYLGVCLQEGALPDKEGLTFKRVIFERRLEEIG